MANENKETKKVKTPAPGAEVSTDKKGTNVEASEIPGNPESNGVEEQLESAPQWAIDLKNTCDLVLTAIGEFNENAGRVVRDIIEEANGIGSKVSKSATPSTAQVVKVNKKAKYVVANGKAFHSSVSGAIVKEGTDITGLETERLEKLIAQGIAVEKSEED